MVDSHHSNLPNTVKIIDNKSMNVVNPFHKLTDVYVEEPRLLRLILSYFLFHKLHFFLRSSLYIYVYKPWYII